MTLKFILGAKSFLYCGRRTIAVPGLTLDWVAKHIYYAPQFPTTPPKKIIKTEVEVRFLFPTEVEKNYKKKYDT